MHRIFIELIPSPTQIHLQSPPVNWGGGASLLCEELYLQNTVLLPTETEGGEIGNSREESWICETHLVPFGLFSVMAGRDPCCLTECNILHSFGNLIRRRHVAFPSGAS